MPRDKRRGRKVKQLATAMERVLVSLICVDRPHGWDVRMANEALMSLFRHSSEPHTLLDALVLR